MLKLNNFKSKISKMRGQFISSLKEINSYKFFIKIINIIKLVLLNKFTIVKIKIRRIMIYRNKMLKWLLIDLLQQHIDQKVIIPSIKKAIRLLLNKIGLTAILKLIRWIKYLMEVILDILLS